MFAMLVTGHGHFGTGMLSAFELLAGRQEGVVAIDFPDGMTTDELSAAMAQALDGLAGYDGVLVCCDLVGGSPFKTAVVLAQGREDVRVISGTNLPLLIETGLSREGFATIDQMADEAIAAGSASFMKYATMSFDDDLGTDGADDEDGI